MSCLWNYKETCWQIKLHVLYKYFLKIFCKGCLGTHTWMPECQTYLKFRQNISHTIVQNCTEDHLEGFGTGFSSIIVRAVRCIQSHWTLLNPCSESAQCFSPTSRRSGIQPLMSNHLFIKLFPLAGRDDIDTLRQNIQKHEGWSWFAKVKGTRKANIPFVAPCRFHSK